MNFISCNARVTYDTLMGNKAKKMRKYLSPCCSKKIQLKGFFPLIKVTVVKYLAL